MEQNSFVFILSLDLIRATINLVFILPWDQVVLYIRHIQLIFKSRIIDIIVQTLNQSIGNDYEIMSSTLSSRHRVKSRLFNCGWIWSCQLPKFWCWYRFSSFE